MSLSMSIAIPYVKRTYKQRLIAAKVRAFFLVTYITYLSPLVTKFIVLVTVVTLVTRFGLEKV